MLFLSLIGLATAADLPTMTYSRNGDDHVVDVAAFEAAMGPAVEAAIARRASELCAGLQISWGKFAFDEHVAKVPGAVPSAVKSYRREFRCIPAETRAATPAPADWTATADDERDVRGLFATYYAKRDGGDFAASRAMMSPVTVADPAGYQEQMSGFNRTAGKGSRRVTKVTWYVNPTQSDRPGVYAALDFSGSFSGFHLYCGYLMLYRFGPGRYEIVREEQTSFVRNGETPDPAQLAQLRAATCRE